MIHRFFSNQLCFGVKELKFLCISSQWLKKIKKKERHLDCKTKKEIKAKETLE